MNSGATIQLRHLFEIVSGSTPESGYSEYWDGDIAWVTPEDVSQVAGNVLRDTRRKPTAEGFANSGTTIASAGGIVLTKRAPIGQLALLGIDACSNQGCFLLSPREGIEPRFFYYVLANSVPLLQALGRGSTFMELSTDDLNALHVPVLAYDQQVRIANYLDASVAKVDELLQFKRGLLEILAEKRKAIIAIAVTRGLDPSVKLRDSGVPWLGEIPANWDVTRLKFRLNGITQGWSPQCEALPAGPDDWGVLKAGCVNGDAFNAEENKRLPDAETPLPEIEIRPRDVVMSRANTTELVGSAAIAPADVRSRLMLSDKLYRLNVKVDELLPELLVHFLRTSSGRFEFERTASGASNSMQNISQDVVRNLWIPVPPHEEQRAIVDHIARETAKLDAVGAATERTIALLKERRSALIAAAVTGQLDVGAAA